jgi:hypothetical protein
VSEDRVLGKISGPTRQEVKKAGEIAKCAVAHHFDTVV